MDVDVLDLMSGQDGSMMMDVDNGSKMVQDLDDLASLMDERMDMRNGISKKGGMRMNGLKTATKGTIDEYFHASHLKGKNPEIDTTSSKKNGDRDLGMEVEETKDVGIRSVMHVVGPTLLRKRTKKDSKKQTQTKLKKKGAKSRIRKGFVAKRANSDSS